jgi:hypothetical protein
MRTRRLGKAVDALDGDQIVFDHVHDPVRADAQPVVVAAVEGVRRVRVAGQLGDRAAAGAHPVLVCLVAAG